MDETELQLRLQELEMRQQNYAKYLDSDKKRLERQDETLRELTVMTAKLSEQNLLQAELIRQNKELIGQNKELVTRHLDRPSFWDSKNGGILFKVLIIAGAALLVASLGLNITGITQFVK